MKQKYPNEDVISPGTVIISAAGNCNDITKVVEPTLNKKAQSIYYLNLSSDHHKLGGSAFAQILNKVGTNAPDIKNPEYFKNAFNILQSLVSQPFMVMMLLQEV